MKGMKMKNIYKIQKRVVTIAFSAILALIGFLLVFPNSADANAAVGKIPGFSCANWENNDHGETCIALDPTGYTAAAHKWEGGGATFNFQLLVGTGDVIGSAGNFHLNNGEIKMYVFQTGYYHGYYAKTRLTVINDPLNRKWCSPRIFVA
jgi:hypothetical protein